MRVLFYSSWPGQGFYTQFSVTGVKDFEGRKLRIYSTATQEMGELLGFEATILPFAEIPQAFSTGLIEALFTSPQTGIDIKAWDNTSHFTYAGAIFSKNAVIVNEAMFQSLDRGTRDAVLAAAEAAELRAWEMSAATTEEQIGILEENSMVATDAPQSVIDRLIEIGDTMMATWREDASPEAEALLGRFFGITIDSTETAGFCLVATTFVGLAYTLERGGYIRVNLVIRNIHGLPRRIIELWCTGFTAVGMAYFTYWAFDFVRFSYTADLISPGLMAIPFWIPRASMALGLLLFTIALVDEFVAIWRRVAPSYDAERTR